MGVDDGRREATEGCGRLTELPAEAALIGLGRAGFRLATALAAAGIRLVGIRDRVPVDPTVQALLPVSAACDTWDSPAGWRPAALVIICVPDRAITAAAEQLVASSPPGALKGSTVVHTSGLLPAQALAPCAKAGALVASMHPLQSFPPPGGTPVQLDGVAAAVEGDAAALEVAWAVARKLGMRPWRIEASAKPRYHAAAVVAANLTHLLVRQAAVLMEGCGLAREAVGEALGPLVLQSTSAALAASGLEALTGPAMRGDTATIMAHLEALPNQVATAYLSILALLPDLATLASGCTADPGSLRAAIETCQNSAARLAG